MLLLLIFVGIASCSSDDDEFLNVVPEATTDARNNGNKDNGNGGNDEGGNTKHFVGQLL